MVFKILNLWWSSCMHRCVYIRHILQNFQNQVICRMKIQVDIFYNNFGTFWRDLNILQTIKNTSYWSIIV